MRWHVNITSYKFLFFCRRLSSTGLSNTSILSSFHLGDWFSIFFFSVALLIQGLRWLWVCPSKILPRQTPSILLRYQPLAAQLKERYLFPAVIFFQLHVITKNNTIYFCPSSTSSCMARLREWNLHQFTIEFYVDYCFSHSDNHFLYGDELIA